MATKKKKFDPTKQSRWKLSKPLHVKRGDKRYKRCQSQLKKRGFSYDETWNLDAVIAEFILPRLKCYEEVTGGIPGCMFPDNHFDPNLSKKELKQQDKEVKKKWHEILNKMVRSFELMVTTFSPSDSEHIEIEEGLDLFRKYFHALWW